MANTRFVSLNRWESPQLYRSQRESRHKRIRQRTFQKCFFFLLTVCFLVLIRLFLEWNLVLDILILCTFICFILQLGSLFIPQRKVGTSDVVTQASKQKDCFFPVDSPSPADRKLDTSPRDLVVGRSPMPFSLETSSSEYLKPFQSDTNTGTVSPIREETVAYPSSHFPIRTSPYFHSVSPSFVDSATWFKYRTVPGYPISNEQIEKCRGWIVQTVIRPFVARIIPWMKNIPYLSSKLDIHSFHCVEQSHSLVKDTKEEFLHRYLSMESYPSAGEYILERLVQLAKDNYMSLYSTESPWSLSNVPSDAEIVVHVVSCFMDEVIQRTSNSVVVDIVSIGAFSKRHIDLSYPSPLVRSNGNESLLYKLGGWRYRCGAVVCLLQRRPAIFVVVGQGGKCLSIPMGRNNVFAALIGLFQLVDDYYDGQVFHVAWTSPWVLPRGANYSRVAKNPSRRWFSSPLFRIQTRASFMEKGDPSYEEFANWLKQGVFPWETNDNQKEQRGNPNCSLCKGEFYISCENCNGVGFLFIPEENLWRTCQQCIGQGKNSCPVCDIHSNDDWE